ncbi:MAG TPA: aspartate kinase [Polyangiaceae bacterium]|jgi:aspartate kinase
MSIIVQKYGGSSVADVEKIGAVADKVVATKKRGHDVVVVVSAMGKTTDELIALAKKVSKDPPRRELDMLVTTGERVSMALLAIAIQSRGCEAISFTGSQSGIITNDRHFDARIIEVRPHRIEDELARGTVVIVAGYQGMSYKREITTLGRGGSDTTAVALAAALGAERCEIYSDVDGVYSADPRVVPDAEHLPEIDLAMLQEMAESGAKVLNAQAVEWARRQKIAIFARKTADATPNAKETVAREDAQTRARAIVGMDRIVLVSFAETDAPHVLATLADLDVPFVDASAQTAAIPLLNLPDWDRRRAALEARLGARAKLEDGLAIASVVGDGLAGAVGRFLAALDQHDCKPRTLLAGPLRIAAAVPSAKLGDVQRALHAAFVAMRPPTR